MSTRSTAGSAAGQPGRCFVSHVSAGELAELRRRHPASRVPVHGSVPISGWATGRCTHGPKSTVLDVHEVSRGDRVGYRQRRIAKDGHVLVLSGGTAHGIALEAPAPAASTRQRAVSVAKGGLEADGPGAVAVRGRRQAALVRRATAHAGEHGLRARRGVAPSLATRCRSTQVDVRWFTYDHASTTVDAPHVLDSDGCRHCGHSRALLLPRLHEQRLHALVR